MAGSNSSADPFLKGPFLHLFLPLLVLLLVLLETFFGGPRKVERIPAVGKKETSREGICPPFFLKDEKGRVIDPLHGRNPTAPYSPRKTCGECHDVDKIAEGYHFTQGAGERPTPDQAARVLWASTPGNYGGTWCSPGPLYPYLSPKKNSDPHLIDMTSFSFVTIGCGHCHPGGGPVEFDREGKRYDLWMKDPRNGLKPGGENGLDGDYYRARWSETGVLEPDCLICHLPEYDMKARNGQLDESNFRWAATAGARLGKVLGSIKSGKPVKVQYNPAVFGPNGKVSLHIVREPRDKTCLACHAKPGWKKRGANFRPRTDVHLRAGLKCVDCHPAGRSTADPLIRGKEVHQFGKGDDPGGHVRDDLDNTCLDCADCHTTGHLGAPIARHEWLPPLHMEKLACQTCHIPERMVKAAQVQAGDVFNPGVKIPKKGKHLWTFYGPDMRYWNHYGELVSMGYDDKPTDPYRPVLVRYKGKIFPVNRVHTAWPAIRIQGKKGLMEPRMSDIYKMWAAHKKDQGNYPSLSRITDDNGDGVIEVNRPAEVDALIEAVTSMLEKTGYPMKRKKVVWVMDERVYESGTKYTTIPMRPWEASPYGNVHKYNHDVLPALSALGSGGCTDCHAPSSHVFFDPVVRYPFDAEGRAVTEPQYKVLGISAFSAELGAWREAIFKPAETGLLAALLCLVVLEALHIILLHEFNTMIFNAICSVVGGITGVLAGRRG